MRAGTARAREVVRTCVGCRRRASPGELVRLVAGGDRILVSRTAPGRGVWLCPDRSCFERAVRARALTRALRRSGELDLREAAAWFGAGNGAQRGVRG